MRYLALLPLLLLANPSNAATTPHKLLPDGIDKTSVTNPYTGESGYVRKGTIGATISNIASLNNLLKDEINVGKNEGEAIETSKEIYKLIHSLNYLGFFDLISPETLIKDNAQPGKVVTGILYFKTFPEKTENEMKSRVNTLLKDKKYSFIKKL